MFHLVGIIADKRNVVAETYAKAIGTQSIFEAHGICNHRQLRAWARKSVSYLGRRVIVVLTDDVVPYLFYIKQLYNPQIVSVRFDHTRLVFDYDAVFTPHELGWGVDKKKWARIAESRRPKFDPTFFMLSRDSAVESRIKGLGYKVAYGGPEKFYLGDVAIQPSKVDVPALMYEAASSGMGVVSTKANVGWTMPLGAYSDVCLEDGLESVVQTVKESDFVYAGFMARDMVLSMDEFRVKIRALLTRNLSSWA